MSKLSFEQNAILNAIKYHGKRTVREISNAVRTVVVITESEVKEFVEKIMKAAFTKSVLSVKKK